MMRRVVLCLLSTFLTVGSLARADDAPDKPEPPVRLKKKNRIADEDAAKPPAAEEKKPALKEPAKDGEPKKEAEPEPQNPEQDEKETLERLSRNLRTVDERLANKEVGDATRQVQRDILKDLDALIEISQRPPQNQDQKQQDAESAASDSKPSAGKQPQPNGHGQRQQQTRGNRRGSRSQTARGQKQGEGAQPKDPKPQGGAGDKPGAGKNSPEGANKLADVYKDVWGHLPESLRQEMNAYSREQFMAKYEDLIKQYYARIAEKSRRKGD
jgi:hypothetical protein